MAALQLCNEDQRRVILEGINSLDWILERTTDEIARPLNNEGIGQSFTYHFGRRLNQYRRRVWERLWAIRQELIAHHGSLPIFCFDVEGRCTEQPDRALYIDVNRAFVVVCPVWFDLVRWDSDYDTIDQTGTLLYAMLQMPAIFRPVAEAHQSGPGPNIWAHVPRQRRVNNAMAYVFFMKDIEDAITRNPQAFQFPDPLPPPPNEQPNDAAQQEPEAQPNDLPRPNLGAQHNAEPTSPVTPEAHPPGGPPSTPVEPENNGTPE